MLFPPAVAVAPTHGTFVLLAEAIGQIVSNSQDINIRNNAYFARSKGPRTFDPRRLEAHLADGRRTWRSTELVPVFNVVEPRTAW